MAKLRRSAGTGTTRAINRTVRVRDVFTKVVMDSDSAPLEKGGARNWGGARNAAVSTALSARQVQAIHDAAARAMACDRPLNRFVSIHWGALGIADADAARATGRLVKLASDWCKTKGVKMTWCWTRENDDGDGSKGSHVHIALHCPSEVPIGRMWRRWLKRLTIKKYQRGGIRSRSIGPSLGTYEGSPEMYRDNLAIVIAYMTKGVSRDEAATLGIGRIEFTGNVIGKRAGWWQMRTKMRSMSEKQE